MQKQGGNFILKIFDVFKIKTIEVIYLLCNLYENVFIFKPNTSRCANSEKYIICRNYKNNNKKIISNIIENFDLLINKVDTIYSLFNIELNQLFITKLQEINSIYGQQQLENIKNTINLIREFKILNIQYNLLDNNYNSFLKYLNIFNKNIVHTNDATIEIFNEDYSIIENNNSNNSQYKENDLACANVTNEIVTNEIVTNELVTNEIVTNELVTNEIVTNELVTNELVTNEIVTKYFNKLNVLVNINIQKSINWCKKHQFIINKEFILKY
jgi:hypothetical protein